MTAEDSIGEGPVDAGTADGDGTPYDRQFYEDLRDGSRRSAEIVLRHVFSLLGRPGSIVDFGCGIGTWIAAARDLGVPEVLGLDGDYVEQDMLEVDRSAFRPTDLEHPVSLNRKFDMAMSLEVAEHLPADRAAGFVADLTAAAPVVLFSAAVPGQQGDDHVNEMWQHRWAELFLERGWRVADAIRPKIWMDERVSWWYVQNTFLFAHPNAVAALPKLREAVEATDTRLLSTIHPRLLLNSTKLLHIARGHWSASARRVRELEEQLAALQGGTPGSGDT